MSPSSSVRRDRTASSRQRPNANTGADRVFRKKWNPVLSHLNDLNGAKRLNGLNVLNKLCVDSGESDAKHDQQENGGVLGASAFPWALFFDPKTGLLSA